MQCAAAAVGSPLLTTGAQDTLARAGFDMADMAWQVPGLHLDDFARAGVAGLAADAQILTLDGALPVAHLAPGDRVITRAGARPITELAEVLLPTGTPLVEISENALGGRPDRAVWLPAAQRILLRDWRAKALYGQAQVCVPAGQLADGEYIRLVTSETPRRCYRIGFGRPEILYADGLELASADQLDLPFAA
jgi:hypothetical protein